MAELKPEQNVSTSPNVDYEEEEWYDLLPIEKKLIGFTLGTGIILLIIFVIIFKF